MPSPPVDRLASVRQVTLILRMIIDRRGRLSHGEIIDTEDQSQRRFKSGK